MKLKDRVAIVTGAGSGIGQATALLFAREGARVGVLDLDADAARGTAQQIEKAGGQALALAADVSRGEDNREAIGKTVAAWDRLDIFYANAGVPQWPGAVPFRMTQVPAWPPWRPSYWPSQRWASPDLGAAIAAMRALVADPAPARDAAASIAERIANRYAEPVVAREFLAAMA